MKLSLGLLVLGLACPLLASPQISRHHWRQVLENGRAVVEYSYPQVSGLPKDVQAKVNDQLQNAYAPSPQKAAEYVKSQGTTDTLEDQVSYDVTRIDDRILSVKFLGGEERHPEPHPEHWTKALTLDLHTGESVSLDSLFVAGADFKGRLIALGKKAMSKSDAKDSPAFTQGLHFYLTPHKIVLYRIYEDSMYSDFEAPIAASDLKDILAPGGPLQP